VGEGDMVVTVGLGLIWRSSKKAKQFLMEEI
jgi:hypothetical protein